MRLIASLLTLLLIPPLLGQNLEVEGKAKITQMDKVNTADSVVVRLPDGTLALRDASTLVQFQILSISNDTVYLTNGGFVKLPDASMTNEIQNLTEVLLQDSSAGFQRIKDLRDPTGAQDAVTKNYLETYVDQFLLNLGISLVGIQGMLDAGYCPLDLVSLGLTKDSLYGKMYQGGLIFYLDDQDLIPNVKGLVAAPVDQSAGVGWGCYNVDLPDVPNVFPDGTPPAGPGAEIGDGITNTQSILSVGNCPTAPAALACTGYTGGGYTDWFLPSLKTLGEMWQTIGQGANPPNTNIGGFINWEYWSSTEVNGTFAWYVNFTGGTQPYLDKNNIYRVRAVRAF